MRRAQLAIAIVNAVQVLDQQVVAPGRRPINACTSATLEAALGGLLAPAVYVFGGALEGYGNHRTGH